MIKLNNRIQMLLKQTVKTHLRASRLTWLPLCFFTLIWWYAGFDRDFFLVVGVILLVMNISAIFLHIEYTLKNWNETIEICYDQIRIVFMNGDKIVKTNEVCEVALYMSATLDDSGSAMFLSRESYHYIKLSTVAGDTLIITCLMSNELPTISRFFPNAKFIRYKGGPFWL